jgi:excisionase family DNA binding protein
VGNLMTVAEAAEWAGVSVTIVYGWVNDGELPHYRLGAKGRRGKISIGEDDLNAFLQARKVVGGREAAPANGHAAKAQEMAFRFLPPS